MSQNTKLKAVNPANTEDGLPIKKQKQFKTSELKDKLVEGLRGAYWSEKVQLKLIPRLIKRLESEELILQLKAHLKLTKSHVKRLEDMFDYLGRRAKSIKNKSIMGLISEARSSYSKRGVGMSQDAHILADIVRIEYFEMASYKLLSQLATALGEKDIAVLLEITLAQERDAMTKFDAVPTYNN